MSRLSKKASPKLATPKATNPCALNEGSDELIGTFITLWESTTAITRSFCHSMELVLLKDANITELKISKSLLFNSNEFEMSNELFQPETSLINQLQKAASFGYSIKDEGYSNRGRNIGN